MGPEDKVPAPLLQLHVTHCRLEEPVFIYLDIQTFENFLRKKVGNSLFISHLLSSGFTSRGSSEEAQPTREEKLTLCRNPFESTLTAHLVDVLEFIYYLADDRLGGFAAS